MEKIAVLAPMPSAMAITAIVVKPGVFRICRRAYRRSVNIALTGTLPVRCRLIQMQLAFRARDVVTPVFQAVAPKNLITQSPAVRCRTWRSATDMP